MKRVRPTNWCKPMPVVNSVQVTPTEFEQKVATLRLRSEREMLRSKALRDWAAKNWKRRFVPEELLLSWHIADSFELETLE